MFDYKQFRERIVKTVLHGLGMWNEYAEELMMGTCAIESQGGTYLVQLNQGPAVGIFQMEPKTHDDIWTHWLPNHPAIASNLMSTCQMNMKPRAEYMLANLLYATAMARLQYYRVGQGPIPDNEEDRAKYWLKYYNCGGSGTIDKYLKAHADWKQGASHDAIKSKPQKTGAVKTA